MELSHLDDRGHARMVDVGGKPHTRRLAVARGRLTVAAATAEAVREGRTPKGDVLAAARIAGILAAKRTGEWIPLCHPLPLEQVAVRFRLGPSCIDIEAEAATTGPTGVEMEALTAVSAAALTLYDMLKAVDRSMTVEAVRLVRKEGGRSGLYLRSEEEAWPPEEEG